MFPIRLYFFLLLALVFVIFASSQTNDCYCQNGKCIPNVPEPYCECDRGWTGYLCQLEDRFLLLEGQTLDSDKSIPSQRGWTKASVLKNGSVALMDRCDRVLWQTTPLHRDIIQSEAPFRLKVTISNFNCVVYVVGRRGNQVGFVTNAPWLTANQTCHLDVLDQGQMRLVTWFRRAPLSSFQVSWSSPALAAPITAAPNCCPCANYGRCMSDGTCMCGRGYTGGRCETLQFGTKVSMARYDDDTILLSDAADRVLAYSLSAREWSIWYQEPPTFETNSPVSLVVRSRLRVFMLVHQTRTLRFFNKVGPSLMLRDENATFPSPVSSLTVTANGSLAAGSSSEARPAIYVVPAVPPFGDPVRVDLGINISTGGAPVAIPTYYQENLVVSGTKAVWQNPRIVLTLPLPCTMGEPKRILWTNSATSMAILICLETQLLVKLHFLAGQIRTRSVDANSFPQLIEIMFTPSPLAIPQPVTLAVALKPYSDGITIIPATQSTDFACELKGHWCSASRVCSFNRGGDPICVEDASLSANSAQKGHIVNVMYLFIICLFSILLEYISK